VVRIYSQGILSEILSVMGIDIGFLQTGETIKDIES
jgi:hypothetical protein